MRHPCLKPRCPVLVGRGVRYCPTHTTEAAQQDIKHRGNAASRGYDAEWQQVQAAYLQAHPYCERCATKGRKRKAQLVDHKIALRDGGERLAWSNLMALCRHCHGIKTHTETQARETKADFFQDTPRMTARQSALSLPSFSDELGGWFFA